MNRNNKVDKQNELELLRKKIAELEKLNKELIDVNNKYIENEKYFKFSQKISHFGNYNYNIKSGEVIWSDELIRIYGLDQQKTGNIFSIEDSFKYVHPEDAKELKFKVDASIGQKKGIGLEYRIKRKDGTVINIFGYNEPIFDDSNNLISIFGTVQDITELKKTENLLIAEKEFSNKIIETSDAIIIGLDINHTIRLFNKGAEKITGFSKDEVLGKDWFEIFFSKSIYETMIQVWKNAWGNTSHSYINPIIVKSGAEKMISWHTTGIYDNKDSSKHILISIGLNISERIKTEDELKKFKTIADQSNSGIVISSMAGEILYINDNLASIHGYSPQELIGKSIHIFYNDDQIKIVKKLRKKILKTQNFVNKEIWHIKRDGTIFPMLMNGIVIYDDMGNPLYRVGTAIDITERKKAEEQINQRFKFEQLVASISSSFVGTYILEDSINILLKKIGDFCSVSRSYLFLITKDGKMMNNVNEWCNQGVESQIDNLQNQPTNVFPWWMAKLYKGESIIINDVCKLPIVAKIEKEILLEQNIKSCIIFPLQFNNNLIGFIGFDNVENTKKWDDEALNVLQISSEILQNALHRKRIDKAIITRERIYRTLINNLPGFVYRCKNDKNWTMIYMSNGVEKITDYPAEDFTNNKKLSYNDIICLEYKEKVWNDWQDAIINKSAVEIEYQIQTKNQEIRWVWEKGCGIFSENGDLLFLEGFITDITEYKKTEEELFKMQKIQSIGILAGGIAHDFNNILTSLYGNISIAKMKLEKNHPIYPFLDEVENSMNRATRLTTQLLTFSKGGSPIKEIVNLDSLLEEIISFDLSGSNVKPIITHEKNLWLTRADRGQIQQVFSNLTINANQAMPNGGNLYISFENTIINSNSPLFQKAGQYLKITMRDEGTGIDPKHIDKIFDPYFTTKQAGNGLGLATVYSIINKHNGYIDIESKLGKGTIFTIYLPAFKTSSQKDPIKNIEENLVVKQKAKILIMDDDKMICDLVFKMIQHIGYSCEIVNDGEEAIKQYTQAMKKNDPFDLVIMDLTIPGGMGGKEAVNEILAIDPLAKVIVSSGYAIDPVMANFAEYGFINCITKPYTITNLKRILNTVLLNNVN